MQNEQRTIPSQEIRYAWLAGIIDGEGTIAHYKTKQGKYINGVVIVNTDVAIISAIEACYDDFGIYYAKHSRKKYTEVLYPSRKECFEVVVRRKKDVADLLNMVSQYLCGDKKNRAQDLLNWLEKNPRQNIGIYICELCHASFKPGRKRRFCSQKCWHKFAKGKDNPNYRHGKRISGVTTKREAPALAG